MKERASENAASSPRRAPTCPALPPDRRWRRALAALAAGAAVIAAVVVAVVATRGSEVRQTAGTSPSRAPSGWWSAVTSPSATPSQYRVAPVHQTAGTPPSGARSQYRVARTVTIEPVYLDCRTESVCYAWFTRPVHSGSAPPSERTSDGGARWQMLASPPDSEVLDDSVEPSCPTATMCVAVTERDTLAVTTDSGASWRLDPLPAVAGSAGWIDQLSCATTAECVVHITGEPGTFLSTTNGGQSWTAATQVPRGAPPSLQFLRCDPSGRCIGAVSARLGTAYAPGHGPGLKIMRSADNGLTWSVSAINNVPPASSFAPRFQMSCGDALHCLYAGGSGVAITSDGGLAWHRPATPAWQSSIITSVSCAQGLHCSVALAPELASQVPVIESTSDGMAWAAQPLPPSADDPLQYVTLLSCPSPGGCVGLASTLSQERSAFLGSGGFSSGIVETSPQMLISGLHR